MSVQEKYTTNYNAINLNN